MAIVSLSRGRQSLGPDPPRARLTVRSTRLGAARRLFFAQRIHSSPYGVANGSESRHAKGAAGVVPSPPGCPWNGSLHQLAPAESSAESSVSPLASAPRARRWTPVRSTGGAADPAGSRRPGSSGSPPRRRARALAAPSAQAARDRGSCRPRGGQAARWPPAFGRRLQAGTAGSLHICPRGTPTGTHLGPRH